LITKQYTQAPEGKTLLVPSYSKWSDDRLMEGDDQNFMKKLYHRAKDLGDDCYDAMAYELTPLDPEIYRQNLIYYMRRRAWSEWFFGTVSPARQITLLPDDQEALKFRLARQIHDEIRHYDVFEKHLRRYGAEVNLNEFQLPEILVRMQKVQLEMETASEIAATNQFAGEVVLTSMTDREKGIFAKLVDEELMDDIENIEMDEPPHVANGRDLILLFCATPDQRRRLASAQEQYLAAMVQLHALEIVKLGSRRLRPLPVFD